VGGFAAHAFKQSLKIRFVNRHDHRAVAYHRVDGAPALVIPPPAVEPSTPRYNKLLEWHVLRRRSKLGQADHCHRQQGVNHDGAAYQMQSHDCSPWFPRRPAAA